MANELVSPEQMAYWIKNRQNVLFRGKHGVGKTQMILEAWKKAGLKYLYFSGATMDPFIDFVGVPVKVGTKNGEVIKLLRPEHLQDSHIQAIFIDEFNRTHKKVRNAVMELMQFKTINGTPLSKHLHIIWAAVNPDNTDGGENDYDTDRLDPAQADRFQVHVDIPFQCSLEYFTKKYDKKTAETAIKWWNNIDEKIRDKVSPRRLDYALETYTKKGDMRDVLPPESNVTQLVQLLKFKGKTLDALISAKDTEEIKKFFQNENNYNLYLPEMLVNKKYYPYFYLLPAEKLTSLIGSTGKQSQRSRKIVVYGMQHKHQRDVFGPILIELFKTGFGTATVKYFVKALLKKHKLTPKPQQVPVVGAAPQTMIPKPKSSLGTLIALMMQASTHVTETALRKSLQKMRGKIYTSKRWNNIFNHAKTWLKANGYKVLTSTSTGGIIVQEAK